MPEAFTIPSDNLSLYKRLRRMLARIGFARSGWHFLRALKEAWLDSPARGQAEFNREFGRQVDPYGYDTAPYERQRLQSEIGMLDAVRGEAHFGKALEVGCAEGAFTQMLVERCDSLLAADISPVALARARQRRRWEERVRFAQLDLRGDPLPDTFDLIVAVHVLECIRSFRALRRARTKLVDALRPGGYLLIGNFSGNEPGEKAWWGRYFLRGGERISDFMVQHPALRVVNKAVISMGDDVSIDVLCQKTG
ncbi:MAG: methyltransferase domain-containing protein [Acidobacteria bacterium]|nr:methyltransferase domain-containing protein [Acidobacteriota bacterium]